MQKSKQAISSRISAYFEEAAGAKFHSSIALFPKFIFVVRMENTENLRKKVTEQGNVVRDLKAQKAPKEEITAAVNTLLALKTELKEAEQLEIGNLFEEIAKLKQENADESLIKEKEERLETLKKSVEPTPEKKPKEKKVQIVTSH